MKKKIKVAFVINDLLVGGAQTAVHALASKIDRTLFEPAVFYLNQYPPERTTIVNSFVRDGITPVYIGNGGKTRIPRAIKHLRREFKKNKPDVIHAHLPDAVIASLLAALLLGGIPTVIHEHRTHTFFSKKIKFAYRILRSFSHLTLCYAPSLEEELFGSSELLTSPPKKIDRQSYSVLNGVDFEKIEHAKNISRNEKRKSLSLPMESVVITSVARLIEWKGQTNLIEAFVLIAAAFPEAHLCLVGEGSLRTMLEARIEALGLQERVHLLGARTDVYEILAVSDIGSLAFTYDAEEGEAIGIAGFEVMAMGLPLIVSNYHSAHAYVVDGRTAQLVIPHDSKDLARVLTKLIENPSERVRIGGAASKHVQESMNWSILTPIYERIYKLILSP